MSVRRQIIALVAGALLLSTAIFFAVTFAGPPPMRAPVPLASVAQQLGEGRQTHPSDIRTIESPVPPQSTLGQHTDRWADTVIASKLGVSPDRVRGVYGNDLRGPGGGPATPETGEILGGFSIGLQTDDGSWRIATLPEAPTFTRWHAVTLGAMGLTLVALLLLASRIARAIAAPLDRLASAADATHARPDDPEIPRDGPPEVQRVATALADMRDRLTTTLSARTDLLVGIAHDLGTPLMRLALRIEELPSERRAAAHAEIDEMRRMTRSVLDFARGVPVEQQPVELRVLLERLVHDVTDAGAKVTLVASDFVTVSADATALRRLIGNLIENAERYAGPSIVTLGRAGSQATVTVTDSGPGFDPEMVEQLFEPFVRGERSRSRETGGTGLGLAIARRIAEAHGGTLTASVRPEGGAAFALRLPLGA